ncbi:MAG: response regulator [Methanomicrobiales archaeon]|nr:response regulator [Methanomicrobiales archaeon]
MPHKILVVDDDTPTLEVMKLILRKIGCEPVVVDNGWDALNIVRSDPPSLILMDVMMSPMNGWQFLELKQQDERIRNVPVMLFTAKSIETEELKRYGKAIVGVLEKPISPLELKAALQRFFHEG